MTGAVITTSVYDIISPSKNLIIVILLLMTNDMFSQPNKFRGLIMSEMYLLERQDYFEAEKDAINATLNGFSEKPIIINRAVCGDTVITQSFKENGSDTLKDILIGDVQYLKIDNYYKKMGAAPHPLEKINWDNWKKVREKKLREVYQYSAIDPRNFNNKYYIDIENRFEYVYKTPLRKSFAKIFSPFGTYKKLMEIYPGEVVVTYYKYFKNDEFNCSTYMEDFKIDSSNDISFKDLILDYTYNIIPVEERTDIPFGELKDKNGQIILTADLKNKLIYIDMWASWCKPCIKAMPSLKEIHEKYVSKGLKVVSISIEGNEEEWLAGTDDLGITWANFLLMEGFNSQFSKEFAINTIPRYILVDAKGRIINENAPPPTDPKLEKILDSLLSNKSKE